MPIYIGKLIIILSLERILTETVLSSILEMQIIQLSPERYLRAHDHHKAAHNTLRSPAHLRDRRAFGADMGIMSTLLDQLSRGGGRVTAIKEIES